MSEDWICSGVEVAEVIPADIGPDRVHFCFVDHVTDRMIVLENGHRYWRDTLCPIGKMDGYTRTVELCRPNEERVLNLRALHLAAEAFDLVRKVSEDNHPSTSRDVLALLAGAEGILRGARGAIINDLPWKNIWPGR